MQRPEKPSEEILRQAATMLKRFFESPFVKELAAAKTIYREIDFLLPWPPDPPAKQTGAKAASTPPQTVIAGIIDVLIETDDGWHVLDYKTGEFPPGTPDDLLVAPYELQLSIYAQAVEEWFGADPTDVSLMVFRPDVRRIRIDTSIARSEQVRIRINASLEALRRNSIKV